MPALYVLNTLDNKRASSEVFQTKKEAKLVRNKLIADGTRCVVSRGPDHPLGPSRVDIRCQNTERTTRRRYRSKALDPL